MSSVKVFIGDQSIKTSKEVFRKLAWRRALATYGVRDVLAPGTLCVTWSVGHNSPLLGIHLVDRKLLFCLAACPPRKDYTTPMGTFMGKKDLVAHRVQALQRSAQVIDRLKGRLEVTSMAQENENWARFVSRARSGNGVIFKKAAQGAAVAIKANKIMLTQYGAASASLKPRTPDSSEEALINGNANYKAYISELGRLERSGFEGFVAYANGKRIARTKTFDALIKEIGTRQEDVLIQEVPAKVINFRQPFQVET